MKTNREFSGEIIQQLMDWGVEEFYVCAGARNIPLVETLLNVHSEKKIIFNHFEERCAAFYAIGRIKSINKPVCVVTTSGTAVGELLAPTMEAFYSSLPLILLTADRPKSFRGTGAPQSAEQNNIFGCYVSGCIDIETHNIFDISPFPKNKPLHINVCFETPLQNGVVKTISNSNKKQCFLEKSNVLYNNNLFELNNFLKENKNILIIVTQIKQEFKNNIIKFLLKLNAPIYLESISNLRECPELSHLQIKCADKIWENSKISNYKIKSVLKIGGTPTHRIWRDLEEIYTEINVLSLSNSVFSGHSRAKNIYTHFEEIHTYIPNDLCSKTTKECELFFELDKKSYILLQKLFAKYPNSEQSIMYTLSQIIPNKSRIYLGNSLPIRHWDLAAQFNQKDFYLQASRGLNGIDGQLSTFFGFADSNVENFAIIGDLTALYDLTSAWALQYQPQLTTQMIVINNNGGKIFGRVLKGKEGDFCQNTHTYHLEYWCKMWNINYYPIHDIDNLAINSTHHNMYEVFASSIETNTFHEESINI